MQISKSKTTNSKKTEWESLFEIEGVQNKIQPIKEHSTVHQIWEDNFRKIITKTEQQIVVYLEAYTQIQKEFLHSVDDLFVASSVWQKQYFDKLGIDQNIINSYAELCEAWTSNIIEFMDMYTDYKKIQADLIINNMRIGRNYLHGWADMYSKVMSFWNSH